MQPRTRKPRTYGCDALDLEEQCLDSATITEGGNASAVFSLGGEFEQEVPGVATLTESGWCLAYKTSHVTTFLGEERHATNYLDHFTVRASWYPGGDAGNSTTCVPEGEKTTSHSEWVHIFLHNSANGVTSAGIEMAYSCITRESNSHVFTYMGIGLSDQRNIKNDYASYKTLSARSYIRRDEVNGNVTHPYAYLEVDMKQEQNSWEIVTEIDPLNVGEILGSIGGFWDLILILWPIFFVAATHQGPSQKPRDFKKYAAGVTGFVGVTASVEGPLKNTSMSGAQSGRPKGPTELQVEQAHWETTSPAIHSVQRLDV